MKTVLVVNPKAGRQNIKKELSEVCRIFEEDGREVLVLETEDTEKADEMIRRAVEEEPELLVCCGGDGTLNETVNQVRNTGKPVTLGYIPAGTTNDFASSLGLPREPAKAARHILEHAPRTLDAGRFEKELFLYVASFGAFTQASYQTDQALKNSLGHLAYVIEGIKELPTLRSYALRAETAEGESYEGDFLFGAVSNSTSIGGIVKLSEDKVDLSDGRLELMLIRTPKTLLELHGITASLLSGKLDHEMVIFTHTKKVRFFCQEPMDWSLDGEHAVGGEVVEAEVLPGEIRLCC